MPTPSKARSGLPRLVRRGIAGALTTACALLFGAMALATPLDLGDGFALRVLLLFSLAALWLGAYLPDHLPHDRLGPANRVTLVRLGLTALLGGMIGEPAPAIAWPALGIAALVLALDGVDGWLARRGGWASAFGAHFDMETDGLLIVVMTVLVWQLDKAGAWVLLSGAMRYLFVAAGLVLPRLRGALPPSRRRKTVCVLQILALWLALAPFVPRPWSGGLAAAGLGLLCYSFLVDIAWLLRRAAHSPMEPLPHEHH